MSNTFSLSAFTLKCVLRSNQSIIEDIRHGNSDAFGPEPLRELLKLLPDSEEVKRSDRHSAALHGQIRVQHNGAWGMFLQYLTCPGDDWSE